MGINNKYKAKWEFVEKQDSVPRRMNKKVTVSFNLFKQQIIAQDPKFVKEIVQSLYNGDVYILKGAFSSKFMIELREKLHKYGTSTDSSFHKMLEGCPDFHRIIDSDVTKNYSFESIKHSFYFFPWNNDQYDIFKETYPIWRAIKMLCGLDSEEYEKNTPKDGMVDRIQIVHYPSGAGRIETHSDPYQVHRLIISCFMSKRGVDYEQGGVYFINKTNQKVDFENDLEIGDMQIYFPTILHGVNTIDEGKVLDWSSSAGRWWFGPFSNSSNHVEKRYEGFAVKQK
ncbi:hypothetical protein J4437_07185 [Candidatus Woesearchaeota archaeon]|nr:hypothetical protein [Candidatus Woesearchaeota archaeon]